MRSRRKSKKRRAATDSSHSALVTQEMIEEGYHCLADCVADRGDRFPKPEDRPGDFAQKRNQLLNRIVPMSIVPLATSNAMLVMGSSKTTGPGGDCSFPLPQYLIWAGAMSLSLVIFGVVGRHVLGWVLEDRYVSEGEQTIVSVLEYLGTFTAFMQGTILLSGTAVLFPHMGHVNTTDRTKQHYCDRGLVVFSVIFLSMCWVFVLFAAGSYVYIRWTADSVADEVKAQLLRELLDTYKDTASRRRTEYEHLEQLHDMGGKEEKEEKETTKAETATEEGSINIFTSKSSI